MSITGNIIASGLIATALAAAAAEPAPPTPQHTLTDDLAGPRVAWIARIVQAFPGADDESCLLVERTRENGACVLPPGPSAMVCAAGNFDGPGFAPGLEVEVRGNLGARARRTYGNGTVVDSALIAAPFVAPLSEGSQGTCQAAYVPAPYYPAPAAVGGGLWWHRGRH